MNADPALRLVLTESQSADLRAAAAAAYPKEFCALLIGTERADRAGPGSVAQVTRIVMAANVDPYPERGFDLDPSVLIHELRNLREAERAGQGHGERLLGHAHSHPDAEAIPSARDLAQAVEPGQVWLIISVTKGQAGLAQAFRVMADGAGRTALRMIPLVPADAGGQQETP